MGQVFEEAQLNDRPSTKPTTGAELMYYLRFLAFFTSRWPRSLKIKSSEESVLKITIQTTTVIGVTLPTSVYA